MRRLRFDLRHMLLVIVLVLSTALALHAGALVVVPQLQLPALLPLLALVALDAVITQRVVVRERLDLSEQGGLRAVEAVLIVVAVRVASVWSEAVPLREFVQPWLRDPFTFFGGQFGAYLLPTLLVWLVATLLTAVTLNLEAEPPRAGVRAQPNEEAAALDERARALSRFDRYWLLCVLLALAGATLALQRLSLLAALQSWATARPLLGVVGSVVAGMALHSEGQLDQLSYGWHMTEVAVAADVPRRWQRASGLLIMSAMLGGVLLAGFVLSIPAPPIVPVINLLLIIMSVIVALMIALFGLLLLPFAWLFAWLSGSPPPAAPILPPIQPPQIEQGTPDRPLLPALIFWACVVALVAIALVRYVRQRDDFRALLQRWPRLLRFWRWFGGVWHDLQQWSALAIETVRARFARPARPPRAPAPIRGPQAQMRALYRRLIRSAVGRGVPHSPAQTPHELRAAIHDALPAADADVHALTDAYVVAEYGPRPAQPADVRRARRYWQRIERLFAQARKPFEARRAARKR